MAKSRPHIILSAAVSLDGKIATKTGHSKLSSKKDKIRVHKLRTKVDGILVGSNTVKRDDPLLTARYVKGKNPIRIILDSKGQINKKSRIIKTSKNIPTIIVVTKNAKPENIKKLKKYPVQVIVSGTHSINIKNLLKILWKLKIKKILVEGGGTTNWEFINQKLVDEIIITITPYVIGGKDAISLIEGKGFSKIENSLKLNLQNVSRMRNELVLHYKN